MSNVYPAYLTHAQKFLLFHTPGINTLKGLNIFPHGHHTRKTSHETQQTRLFQHPKAIFIDYQAISDDTPNPGFFSKWLALDGTTTFQIFDAYSHTNCLLWFTSRESHWKGEQGPGSKGMDENGKLQGSEQKKYYPMTHQRWLRFPWHAKSLCHLDS